LLDCPIENGKYKMEKNVKLFALFLIPIFLNSFRQNQTAVTKDNNWTETKVIVTSPI
jgi:hypothetical protein